MVECDLAKVEVAGSNPVSRSIFFKIVGAMHPTPTGSLRYAPTSLVAPLVREHWSTSLRRSLAAGPAS